MKRLLIALMSLIALLPVSAQDSPCENGFRLIEHALGETCVPGNPQRVVPLDMTITELLLISSMQPVAASQTVLDAYTRMHPELEATFTDVMEDIEDTGFPPNIEAVLNAEPDLIIGPRDLFTESLYPQLNEVAPTVLYDPVPGDWRSRLIFAGEVLGLSETVDSLLTDYDERVDELRDQLGEDAGGVEVSLVRTFPGQIGLVLAGTTGAALLDEVGLARPESQGVDYDYVLEELDGRPELLISEEELLLADGDVVFVFGDPSALFEMPLWNALPAVQEDRAHEVGYYWWGDSLLSAHDMLDDLFTYVAVTTPENLNPFAEGLPAASPASTCATGTREVAHAQGTTCVPETPQRIVALDPFTFETMVALNLPIIATPAIYVDELTDKFPQFNDKLSDVVDTGIPINIETLLEAEPDVILCRQTACDGLYEQLSAIAPTVFFDNSGAADWRESARFFAEVIGHGEALAEVEVTFEARLDNLRDVVTAEFNRPLTVSVLRIRPEQLRLYFEDSFPWTVLSAADFTSPEGQADVIAASAEQFGSPRLANISLEQIPVIDADYVFAFTTDGLTPGDAQDYLAELQNNPLWQALDVVQEDRLFIVDNYWFGTGYIAAHAIIDDLYAVVVGVEPEIANPFVE
ncbi:MAG: ABC transporter substrate-binding protein [Chloroflexota bacterium]